MLETKEIIKLHEMLKKANIPHIFKEYLEGYQIIIVENNIVLCDCVINRISYGHEKGLLEIYGALTEKEYEEDEVLGYLNAEEVFKRFEYCYRNNTCIYVE